MRVSWQVLVLGLLLTLAVFPAVAADPLNVVTINVQPTLAPDPAIAADWSDTQVVYNLYSPLVYVSGDGTLKPHLALEWRAAVEGDLSRWYFKLRPGVKFHDGTELTSEDVAFSMERFMTISQGMSGTLGKVLTSEILSEYEVVFHLQQPSAVFPDTLVLFFVVNKELVLANLQDGKFGELGDYGQEWLLTHDAGSGPYMMVEHEISDRLRAVRFEDYFLGWEAFDDTSVPIEELQFTMVTEPGTVLLMMKSRQIDADTQWWAKEMVEALDNTPGIHINSAIPLSINIVLNTAIPPTDDIHFRKAMAYAFDYEAAEALYHPGSNPGHPVASGMPGHYEELELVRRDLGKAREELALSPYGPDDVVTVHWGQGIESMGRIVLQMQANLAEVGINVEVNAVPIPTIFAEAGSRDQSPNGLIFEFAPAYPSVDFFVYYMFHPDITGGVYASHWIADEELGRLIDQSRQTVDWNERLEIYKELQRQIMDLYPAIYAVEVLLPNPMQDYLIGPKEVLAIVGPDMDMHNFRINLTLKQQLLGGG